MRMVSGEVLGENAQLVETFWVRICSMFENGVLIEMLYI